MSGGGVVTRWTEAMRTKAWVTAFVDSSRPDAVPAPTDLVVVKIGEKERVVYRAQTHDFGLGWPIVSPDGTRLAFVKTEQIGQTAHTRLYGMDIDGSNLKMVADLERPAVPIKGASIASLVAWSHDNRALVVLGTLRSVWEKEFRPPQLKGGKVEGVGPPRGLMRVDVVSGEVVQVLDFGRIVWGEVGGPMITSQAWAPDNRRLVYMNKEKHTIILDTVTQAQVNLGPGREPTWSPDGRFIAIQTPQPKTERQGDYVLISTEPPYQRTRLLSNRRTPLSFLGLGYLGAALWFPDSRFLMIYHYPGEVGYPYVVDRLAGEVASIPPLKGYVYSWGGKP